jgi:hypothetical protein
MVPECATLKTGRVFTLSFATRLLGLSLAGICASHSNAWDVKVELVIRHFFNLYPIVCHSHQGRGAVAENSVRMIPSGGPVRGLADGGLGPRS